MNHLGKLISDTRCQAASLGTDLLKDEIHHSIHELDAAIARLYGIPPGAGNAERVFDAAGDVIATALITALYVCELTTRPAPHVIRLDLSPN